MLLFARGFFKAITLSDIVWKININPLAQDALGSDILWWIDKYLKKNFERQHLYKNLTEYCISNIAECIS